MLIRRFLTYGRGRDTTKGRMLKKRILTAGVALAVAGTLVGTAGPASASDPGYPCTLKNDQTLWTTVNNGGGSGPGPTIHAGRGFLPVSDSPYQDGLGRRWIVGHPAEYPDKTGWIVQQATDC